MENASPETDTAVTKVIDRIPREGMDAQLEQAMKNLIAAALKFRGHLGVTVTRPSLPASQDSAWLPLRFLRASARVGRIAGACAPGCPAQPLHARGPALRRSHRPGGVVHASAQPACALPASQDDARVVAGYFSARVSLCGNVHRILHPGRLRSEGVRSDALVVPTMTYIVARGSRGCSRTGFIPGRIEREALCTSPF